MSQTRDTLPAPTPRWESPQVALFLPVLLLCRHVVPTLHERKPRSLFTDLKRRHLSKSADHKRGSRSNRRRVRRRLETRRGRAPTPSQRAASIHSCRTSSTISRRLPPSMRAIGGAPISASPSTPCSVRSRSMAAARSRRPLASSTATLWATAVSIAKRSPAEKPSRLSAAGLRSRPPPARSQRHSSPSPWNTRASPTSSGEMDSSRDCGSGPTQTGQPRATKPWGSSRKRFEHHFAALEPSAIGTAVPSAANPHLPPDSFRQSIRRRDDRTHSDMMPTVSRTKWNIIRPRGRSALVG